MVDTNALLQNSRNFLSEARSQISTIGSSAIGFVKSNPITAGSIGIGATALAAGVARVSKRRRSSKKKKSKAKTRKRKPRRSHTHRRAKRRIVRGRGLGRGEIHHGHKGNKLVSFRTKSGKIVRFKVKGKSRTHLGRKRRRR